MQETTPTMPPNKITETQGDQDDFIFFLAVHVGAGYHSEENVPAYPYKYL